MKQLKNTTGRRRAFCVISWRHQCHDQTPNETRFGVKKQINFKHPQYFLQTSFQGHQVEFLIESFQDCVGIGDSGSAGFCVDGELAAFCSSASMSVSFKSSTASLDDSACRTEPAGQMVFYFDKNLQNKPPEAHTRLTGTAPLLFRTTPSDNKAFPVSSNRAESLRSLWFLNS